MSESRLLAKNTLLIAISKFSSQLLVFLMLPFYTSWLTTAEYGLVDLVVSYGGLFAPLALLNMEMAVFRHLVDVRDDRQGQARIITNAIEITLIASIVAAVLFVALGVVLDIDLAGIMTLYFFAVALGSLILNTARGFGKIKEFAVAGIAQGVVGVVGVTLFVYVMGMGPAGMLLGLAIGALAPALVLVVILGLPSRLKPSARSSVIKKQLLGYSLPLIPNSLSWWAFNVSDRTILFLVISAAANGIYAVSNRFSGALASLWSIFYMSWTEAAAKNIDKPGSDELFSHIANTALRVFGSLAALGIAATAVVFPFFVHANFHEALLYVPVLMVASLFNVVVGFYSALYIAKKLTKQVMYTSVVAAIINLIVNLSLVWFIGIWAAAISTAVAYGIMALNRHYDMKKYVSIHYEPAIFVKVFGLFALVTGIYYLSYSNPELIWLNFAGLAVAFAGACLLNRSLILKVWSYGLGALLLKNKP